MYNKIDYQFYNLSKHFHEYCLLNTWAIWLQLFYAIHQVKIQNLQFSSFLNFRHPYILQLFHTTLKSKNNFPWKSYPLAIQGQKHFENLARNVILLTLRSMLVKECNFPLLKLWATLQLFNATLKFKTYFSIVALKFNLKNRNYW